MPTVAIIDGLKPMLIPELLLLPRSKLLSLRFNKKTATSILLTYGTLARDVHGKKKASPCQWLGSLASSTSVDVRASSLYCCSVT